MMELDDTLATDPVTPGEDTEAEPADADLDEDEDEDEEEDDGAAEPAV